MGKIFISYRREDSQATSDRIFDSLSQRFGKNMIFYDVESIPPGVDFDAYIRQSIRESSVMLVIIGAQWLTVARNGQRRLDDPQDYVRKEVDFALKLSQHNNGPLIIPILVDNGQMPLRTTLPVDMAALAGIQSLAIRRNPDFENDMALLFNLIGPLVVPATPRLAPSYPPAAPFFAAAPPVAIPKKRSLPAWITIFIIFGVIGALGFGLFQLISTALGANNGPWPKGVTATIVTAPVVLAIQNCTSAATSTPSNCPQQLSDYNPSHIEWTLHGDPASGATVKYNGNNKFMVVGVFVMTVNYLSGSTPELKLDADYYQATVDWDPHLQKATIDTLGPYSPSFFSNASGISVPRTATITDSAALAATKSLFVSCAKHTTANLPLLCPQFSPDTYNFSAAQYAVKGSPTQTARVTYDSATGIVHVVGSYVMDATFYYSDGSGPNSAEDNGNYEAYLTLDSKTQVNVIYVTYS